MSKRLSIILFLFLLLFSSLTISAASLNPDAGGFWSPPVEAAPINLLDMERTSDGIVHLVGFTSCCPVEINYTQRDLAGNWSSRELVDDDIDSSRPWEGDMVVGTDGTVHVIWADRADGTNHKVHYAQRSLAGSWTSEVPLSNPTHDSANLALLKNNTNQLYASWSSYGQLGLYTNFQVGGIWNGVQRVDMNPAVTDPFVVMDSQQNIHYFWFYSDLADLQNSGVFYRKQLPNNAFSSITPVSNPPASLGDSTGLFASVDGQNLYVTWGFHEGANQNIYFADFVNGSWNSQTKLNTTNGSFYPLFIGASGGNVYILNGDNDSDMNTFHFRPSGGAWVSDPMPFMGLNAQVLGHVSPDNTFHLIWDDSANPIQYRTRKNFGAWSAIEPIGGGFGFGKKILKQQGGHYDFAWENNSQNSKYSHGMPFTNLPPQGYISAVFK